MGDGGAGGGGGGALEVSLEEEGMGAEGDEVGEVGDERLLVWFGIRI